MPDGKTRLPFVRSPGLDRGFALLDGRAERLYLSPVSLLHGGAAAAALEAGEARPLAGGPFAFRHCEVLVREPGRVVGTYAALAELAAWAGRQGAAVAARVAALLDRLSSARADFAGLALDRPRLMGIVNVTPDSFSDGGDHLAAERAVAHALGLAEAGADIVDVGGESTRPGATPLSVEEELARVVPVLDGCAGAGLGALLSIDSRRAAVMKAALDAGAAIINDVTALAGDPLSLPLAAERRAAVVLVHMAGEPETMNIAPDYGFAPLDVYDALAARVEAAVAAGIPRARIAIDPGLGFGKRTSHNVQLLERLALFHGLGCAVMVGASRKLLIGAAKKETPPKARLGASLAAALAALDRGAQLLRVHDVAETLQAVNLWRALRGTY
ncbi:MAG TPA: dihydropteroate synthase [Alphaproteobacteria bacterium]|nr:dihydropteroate synthase [Alphaproteobacteria bacterium]